MTLRDNWVRHPQSLWVRRALFRVHRWTGIGAGLYILAMSSTGSLIVYRDELTLALSAPVIVASQSTRMPVEELKQAARQRHPEYKLTKVYQAANPNQAVEITFERGGKSMERLFDPYTGADLGNRIRTGFRLLLWLVDLHDNLLSGETGRLVNGIGGLCLTVLALTGSVIWWPGIRNWRHSLSLALESRVPTGSPGPCTACLDSGFFFSSSCGEFLEPISVSPAYSAVPSTSSTLSAPAAM